jgi:hypothetical protein
VSADTIVFAVPTKTELSAARNVLRSIQDRRIIRREDESIVRMWAKLSDRTRPLDELSRDILEQADEAS